VLTDLIAKKLPHLSCAWNFISSL